MLVEHKWSNLTHTSVDKEVYTLIKGIYQKAKVVEL